MEGRACTPTLVAIGTCMAIPDLRREVARSDQRAGVRPGVDNAEMVITRVIFVAVVDLRH